MSMVQELQQKTTSTKKWRLIIFLLAMGGVGAWVVRGSSTTSEEGTKEESAPTVHTVSTETITIGTEGAGTIKGNDLIAVGFPQSSKITEILVKAGDTVKEGDLLAKQDTTSLLLDLQQAQNSFAQTQSSYTQKVNPLTAEEKQQIEKQLISSQLSYQEKLLQLEKEITNLEQTKQNAQVKLQQLDEDKKEILADDDLLWEEEEKEQQLKQDQVSLAATITTLKDELSDLLYQTDLLLGISNLNKTVNDNFEGSLSARNTSYLRLAEQERGSMYALLQNFQLSYTTNEELIAQVDRMKARGEQGRVLATAMTDVIKHSVAGTDLTQSTLDTYFREFSEFATAITQKTTTLINEKENFIRIQLSSSSSLDASTDTKNERLREIEQQITTAHTDLENTLTNQKIKQEELEQTKKRYELDYEISTLDNKIKTNPLSAEEVQLYKLQVGASTLSVQGKQEQLKNATLRSPVAGKIISVNNAVGEYPSQDFVTIATDGDRYVEVTIEEDEVIDLEEGQSVKITPDVLDDILLRGKIRFISPVGTADSNGIVTYTVIIDLTEDDSRLRSSMNVSVEFIAQQAENILTVPVKAVFPYENSPHVQLEDGTYRKVVSGLSDGKMVEIIGGLTSGDRVLVKK